MSLNLVQSKMKKMFLLASLGLIFTSLTSPLANGMMSIPLKKRPVNTNLYPNRSPGTLRNLDDVARKTGGKIIKSSKRSDRISFKIAGMMAFKDAFHRADPQLLEPIYEVEVLCSDEVTGAVMGDLQTRRAMIEGMDTHGHYQKIIAKVPLSEMQDYQSTLKSISQGKAKYKMTFDNYHPVSYEIQKKLMEELYGAARGRLIAKYLLLVVEINL